MATTPWQVINQVFTVERIMTPRDRLLTWEEGTPLDEVLTQAKERSFDLIPVTTSGRISGVRFRGGPVEPLTDRWLIAVNTGVAELLEAFAQDPSHGLLVLRCQNVVGLVTPGDLNKIEVRAYVYNIIGQLEVGLGKMVREAYPDENKALTKLSKERQNEVEQVRSKTETGKVDVGVVASLYLGDLFTVISKTPGLRSRLGYQSRKKAETDLNHLDGLRNSIMHPNRPFVWDAERDVAAQHELIQVALRVLSRLERAPLIATPVVAEGT